MANGENPSWGGNLLEKLKRSPLARVIGAVAVVASAAGLAAGCESTAAGGGSGSRSVNNVIEQSTTGVENGWVRSEEHTSELQSPSNLVCRLLLEKKNYDNHKC